MCLIPLLFLLLKQLRVLLGKGLTNSMIFFEFVRYKLKDTFSLETLSNKDFILCTRNLLSQGVNSNNDEDLTLLLN